MSGVLRGIKTGDYVLAAVLTALGVLLMYYDVRETDAQVARAIADGSMVHTVSSHSAWVIPVFAAATVSALWWRRSVLLVIAVATVVMALHDGLLGWVTRCGAGLPLALVFAFLGALTYDRAKAWLAAGLSALLAFAVVAVDATTGPGVIGLVLPVILIVFGIGRAARHRTVLRAELKVRDAELRQLRDERAALMITDDRAQLSGQLDGPLQERLGQLTTAAESGDGLPPEQARALLETIETDSRRTLDDMREIICLLRGGDAALAPAPTVAHLEALLAQRQPSHARLTVAGDPRSLPASVELSAYRIVEHLIAALADQPEAPIAVALRFDESALEIRVTGPVSKSAEVKEVIARAKERARLLGGTLDVKISRGRAGPARSPSCPCSAEREAVMDRWEKAGIALLVLLLAALPTAVHGWPATVEGNLFTASILASGLTLMWWRTRPRLVALGGGALWLTAAFLGGDDWFPEPALAFMAALAATAALGWAGRAAWLAALSLGVYLYIMWLAVSPSSPVAVVMFSVPGFLAGTVLRQRREAVDELARRGRELEEERELFAEIALRHERARIASELHDIIGHAISVMVIQAAAGQRLVGRDPARTRQAFTAIAESARQGREDLHRLVELLGGTEVGGPDLTLIEEVVTRAAGSGLDVACRFEGDRNGVAAAAAHIAFRVVQESLTNALRHAPGAAVQVLVSSSGRDLTVRVENDRSVQERPNLSGTGRGLAGLRERIQEVGGQLRAGPTRHGGWLVEAVLPG